LISSYLQGREGKVLELPLDRVDSEPVRERRIDLKRLAGLGDLLLLRKRRQSAHVVQAVGELDQDHAHVGGDRDHHLAVVLGLALVAALERDPGELGHAVHERRHLGAERCVDLVEAGAGVLDRVVKQRRAEGLGVESHPGADLRHANRMGDELVARLAHLVGVALAAEYERPLHRVAVDRWAQLVLVLADDRKQVAEQGALLGGQLSGEPVKRRRVAGIGTRSNHGVPLPILGRLAVRLLRACRSVPLLLLRGVGLYGCLRLARYVLPSSKRAL
jgi:hypothetical protein